METKTETATPQIVNEEFWNEYAKMYNKFIPEFQKKLLKQIAQYAHGKTGDFGCGTGKLIPYLNQNPNITSIHSLDASPQMLSFAKKKPTPLPIQYHLLELNKINENTLPLTFDSIFLINVLYANNNPINLLTQINKHLNPNGTLIIGDMNRQTNLNQLITSLSKEYQTDPDIEKYQHYNQILSQNATPKTYTPSELESIIHLIDTYQTTHTSQNHFLGNLNLLTFKKN